MRRIAFICLLVPALVVAAAAVAGADDTRTYKIQMYNAFGVVEGSDVRVAGVNAGTVKSLDITPQKRAEITVELSGDIAELGEDTRCSSEPQSLIAEYFIDCDPDGAPLPDGGTIPASQVEQTVQPDLVQNTLREPFKQRFALILNEFGTALAGNPETLNEAIRLGAPALRELREATEILGNQGALIRDLNVDSEVIIGELSRQRKELVRFFDEAEDAARISAERREDLSKDFDLLDDFLAELNPNLAALEEASREQTPLLTNLRAAAPELNRLAIGLQPFNRAFERSMVSLGDAGKVGRRALRKGSDELDLLVRAGRNAPATAEILADLLSDLDDPRRAVEIDERAGESTGRSSLQPGRRNTMGYTGLEGLLNYAYYQSLVINQFDQVSHLFRFGIYEANTGDCGAFSSGRNTTTGAPQIPRDDDSFITEFPDLGTTDPDPGWFREAADCIGWLGTNQPGVSEDLGLPQYDPSVCPDGTGPAPAEAELCDADASTTRRARAAGGRGEGRGQGPTGAGGGGPLAPGSPPGDPDEVRDELEDLLDQAGGGLGGLGGLGDGLGGLGDGLGGLGGRGDGRGGAGSGGGVDKATEDLLDFLLGP
jgi:ABC-type transporter Mla subunit MlaD